MDETLSTIVFPLFNPGRHKQTKHVTMLTINSLQTKAVAIFFLLFKLGHFGNVCNTVTVYAHECRPTHMYIYAHYSYGTNPYP